MNRILIAEDEAPIANLLRTALEGTEYHCVWAADGAVAADLLESQPFDLVLLDIMLPKINGYELMEYAKTLQLPVIFITAMGTTEHKVKGLKMGAEDYISKPFEIVELLARVETVMRRYNKIGKTIRILDVEIDLSSRVVTQNGKQVLLTLKEYELLLFFARNPNIALYREVIYEQVWEKEYTGDSRTIDLHVQRLKKKLGWDKHICAVYKIGYRLET